MLQLKDPHMKDALLSRLNTFRRNRELCDVVLYVQEREILAHRVVLAASAPALYDMFLLEGKERGESEPPTPVNGYDAGKGTNSTTTPTTATAPAINNHQPSPLKNAFYEFAQGDYECFEALVNFAYTAKLQIPSKKVADLYKTAFSLKVYSVAQACAKYMSEHLSISNCISEWLGEWLRVGWRVFKT